MTVNLAKLCLLKDFHCSQNVWNFCNCYFFSRLNIFFALWIKCFLIILTHVGVNLIHGYQNLHVPSVTKKNHSVTLRATVHVWNNYQITLVSLLDK